MHEGQDDGRAYRQRYNRLDGQQDGGGVINSHPPRPALGRMGREAVLGTTHLLGRRAGPTLSVLDLLAAGDGGAGLHVGILAHHGARQQRGACAHASAFLDVDGAHMQDIAVQPVTGEVHFGLDGGVLAQSEQAGHRRQGVQVHAALDLDAKSTGVVIHARGTCQ